MSYLPAKPIKIETNEPKATIPAKEFVALNNSTNGISHTVYKPSGTTVATVIRKPMIKTFLRN
jgi:hypothetical protein